MPLPAIKHRAVPTIEGRGSIAVPESVAVSSLLTPPALRRQSALADPSHDAVLRSLDGHSLFTADIAEPPPRDDIASMEFPLFALRPGDCAVRHYTYRDVTVEIVPSAAGAATQRDKDILLFCVSQLVEAQNRKRRDIGRTVKATAYAVLTFCQRGTGGKDYARLIDALNRLRGTTLRTDYVTGGQRITEGFGMIESYRLQRQQQRGGRMDALEITLSGWLYNAIRALEVLAINPSYFALRSDLERRLYELARKHCGSQSRWQIGIAKLLQKTGSRSGLREFRRKLKNIAAADGLPDYQVKVGAANDGVVFVRRGIINVVQGECIAVVSRNHRHRPVDNVATAGENL